MKSLAQYNLQVSSGIAKEVSLKPVQIFKSLSKKSQRKPRNKIHRIALLREATQESPLSVDQLAEVRKVRKIINFDCPVLVSKQELDSQTVSNKDDLQGLQIQRTNSNASTEKPLCISRTNSFLSNQETLEGDENQNPQEIPDLSPENLEENLQQFSQERVEKIGNDICYLERNYENLKETETQFTPKNCLQRHDIKPVMRGKMLDWLHEVFGAYKFSDSSYFLTVNIMDRYFWLSESQVCSDELHLIGMTSMFLSTKYEEILPLRLSTLVEKIGHSKYSNQNIKNKEKAVLQTLDFSITGSNIYSFIKITLQALKLQDLLGDDLEFEFIEKICVYMAKMLLFDYILINKYSTRALAAASIYVALKLYEQCLDKNIVVILEAIRDFLELSNSEIVKSSTELLNLARNFDSKFPNMRNLQNFNSDLLIELQQKKQQRASNENRL